MYKKLNFSWVIADTLAASSIPKSKKDLVWLVKNQGVNTIVSLTEEKLTKQIKNFNEIKKELNFKYYSIPTNDGTGFFNHQFEKVIKIFENNFKNKEKMLVHCEGGFGRTSTILIAIWMAHFHKRFEESFEDIKDESIRPQAMITDLQSKSLKEWEAILFD